MKPFECIGLWWLPEAEGNPVAGNLRVASNGNLELSIIGSLGSTTSISVDKKHPIILGQVYECPLGENVSLVSCFQIGSRRSSSAATHERYYASRGFFGAHLKQEIEIKFKILSLKLKSLREWVQSKSGFDIPQSPPNTVLLQYTTPEALTGLVPGGAITLSLGISACQSRAVHSFQEIASFDISCETPKSEDDLNSRYAYPLQNLMTFVCDQAQEIESLIVLKNQGIENPRIHVIAARIYPETDEESTKPVYEHQMLFTLADIEEGFSEFISKWLRLSEAYPDACSVYFSLQYGPPAYIDVKFLAIVQVLNLYYSQRNEGAIRRAEDERRLQSILKYLDQADAKWIVDRIGTRPYPPFEEWLSKLVVEHRAVINPLVTQQSRFINEVSNTFHYEIRRDPIDSMAASRGADLHWLTEKLRFLIKACFLKELGFSAEKIRSLFERNALYKHICELEKQREETRMKGSTGNSS